VLSSPCVLCAASDAIALDETILIEAVVARIADIFNVRLERDGVKRKTTFMKTVSSRWRIHIEEEECDIVDINQPVRNKDLLLIHEIEELASLSRCLESPTCTMYLSQFLRHEYCVETVLFLAEVRNYRQAAEKLAHQSRQIFGLFISDQAVNQVSVEWGLRRAISQNLKTQMAHLADLFGAVEKEVRSKLSNDAFPRFLNSIYCLRLLKHLTLERRQARLRHERQQSGAPSTFDHASATMSEDELPGAGRIQLADMNEIKRVLEKQA
jgi:hypothetical protein